MIHPTDLMALFANLPQQAPINVQVVQPAPDSVGVRFLFAAIPSAFALGIAWIVFRWNGKREHEQWVRSQQAAQNQWIRDQKAKEWKKLLSFAASVEYYMPSVAIGATLIDAIKGAQLDEYLRSFTQTTLECAFASSIINKDGIYDRLIKLRESKERALIEIEEYERSPTAGAPTPLTIARTFRNEFVSILIEIHKLSETDLNFPV